MADAWQAEFLSKSSIGSYAFFVNYPAPFLQGVCFAGQIPDVSTGCQSLVKCHFLISF